MRILINDELVDTLSPKVTSSPMLAKALPEVKARVLSPELKPA
jgi:hypothetical protein